MELRGTLHSDLGVQIASRAGADPICIAQKGMKEIDVAVLSWDYGFLGTRGSGGGQDHSTATSSDNSESIDDAEAEALGLSPVLCMRDRLSQACFWYLVPKKGREFATYENLLSMITDDLDGLGYDRVCFRSDGEPALTCVLEDIRLRWKGQVVPESSAEGDSSSNGNAECGVGLMKGHVRTLKIALERQLGCEISEDHGLLSWLVRHAASTYRRFHVGVDGRTPLERITGRRTGGPIAHFCEAVWWMPLHPKGKPPALDAR